MPRSSSWAPGRCEWQGNAKRWEHRQTGKRSPIGRADVCSSDQLLEREAYQAWVVDTGPLEFLKDPWRLDNVGSPSVSRPLSDVRSPPRSLVTSRLESIVGR
ncbi:hypothetical protein FALCPG4_001558 [Fusarium falciforme]